MPEEKEIMGEPMGEGSDLRRNKEDGFASGAVGVRETLVTSKSGKVRSESREEFPPVEGDPSTFSHVRHGKSVTVNLGNHEFAKVHTEITTPVRSRDGIADGLKWTVEKVDESLGEEIAKVKGWVVK